MKTTNAALKQFIACGHVAIVATCHTTVHHGERCGHMTTVKQKLCPIDRVVSRQEFANLTGQVVEVATGPITTKLYHPKQVKPRVVKKFEVFDFIKA